MSEIKVGDTVRFIGGQLGEVMMTSVHNEAKVRFHGTVYSVWRDTKNLTKVNTDPDAIDKALDEIQDEEGLCSNFDTLVGYAKNMPLLARLKAVAEQNNQAPLYDLLIEKLTAPAYEPPTAPKNGDYVKVSYLDGDTVEGEVGEVRRYRDYNKVGFTGFRVGKSWTVIPEPGSVYFESQPHRVAVTIESVERPVKPVEIDGYWVVRRENYGDVAAWSNAECKGLPQVNSSSMERAWDDIHSYSDDPSMREYVPALLAVIKFFEQEKEAV